MFFFLLVYCFFAMLMLMMRDDQYHGQGQDRSHVIQIVLRFMNTHSASWKIKVDQVKQKPMKADERYLLTLTELLTSYSLP